MDKYEKLISQFSKKIKIICNSYDKLYRDDLEQELYLFLFNLDESLDKQKIINYENYIYICLKNKAIEIYKKQLNYQEQIIHLESLDGENNYSYVNILKDKNNREDADEFLEYVKSNVLEMVDVLLTKSQSIIIKKYFWENKVQKEIAKELKVTQQYISKQINRGLKKLKNYFKEKR